MSSTGNLSQSDRIQLLEDFVKRGNDNLLMGDYELAIAYFSSALRCDPTHAATRKGLADCYTRLGDSAKERGEHDADDYYALAQQYVEPTAVTPRKSRKIAPDMSHKPKHVHDSSSTSAISAPSTSPSLSITVNAADIPKKAIASPTQSPANTPSPVPEHMRLSPPPPSTKAKKITPKLVNSTTAQAPEHKTISKFKRPVFSINETQHDEKPHKSKANPTFSLGSKKLYPSAVAPDPTTDTKKENSATQNSAENNTSTDDSSKTNTTASTAPCCCIC